MIDYQMLFEATPGLYLILDPALNIVAVNDAYLKATLTTREAIIGRWLFDVFPDNPDDVNADGVSNLAASLYAVLEYGKPNTMAVQKYDIPIPESAGGGFEQRYWSPINLPVFDKNNAIKYILHRVEDVTAYIKAQDFTQEQILLNSQLMDKAKQAETEIYRNSQALSTREQEVKNIIEYAPIGMALVGLDKKFLEVNLSFCKMLKYSKSELLKLGFDAITHPEDLSKDLQSFEALLADRIPSYNLEKRYICKDGSIVLAKLTVALLRNENNEPIRFIKQIEDITQQKESEESLRRNIEALNRSNNALDEFAYIASHDLKEPLRGISNYSSFLMEDYGDKLDEEGKGQLRTLQKLSSRLESLLDNLLKFSRVSSIDLAFTASSLQKIVDEKILLLETYLVENNATVDILKTLPEVVCDQSRIGQVFQNLITNGIKYNTKPDKKIIIDFTENINEYIFSVKDNGIGIASEYYDTIFKIFRRLHGRDEYGGGTGAGLTIAKKIIERHGGKIRLESELGVGTTFIFSISKKLAAR